jgi:hypothetical protein
MGSLPLPTELQSIATTLALIALSLVTAPLSFILCCFANCLPRRHLPTPDGQKPLKVLINGAKVCCMPSICRSRRGFLASDVQGARFGATVWQSGLHRRSGRSRLVSSFLRFARRRLRSRQSDGTLSATRFSRFATKHVKLPVPKHEDLASSTRYVDALVALAIREQVDLYVPCSGAGSSIEDALAGEKMKERSGGRIKVFIPSAATTEILHEKVGFGASPP